MTDKPSCTITAPLGRDVLFISSSSETWGDTGLGFMVAFSGGRTAYLDGGSLRIGQDEAKALRRLNSGIALIGDHVGTMQIVHGLLSGKRVLIQWVEARSGKEVTQSIPKYAGLEAAYAQGVKICGWPALDQ
jgi:hypothetical protein